MIDLGIAQVFVGQIAQALERTFHAQLAAPHLLEQLGNFFWRQSPLPRSLVLCSKYNRCIVLLWRRRESDTSKPR